MGEDILVSIWVGRSVTDEVVIAVCVSVSVGCGVAVDVPVAVAVGRIASLVIVEVGNSIFFGEEVGKGTTVGEVSKSTKD